MRKRCVLTAAVAAAMLFPATSSAQDGCGPDALGTSRILGVHPAEHGRIGSMQYPETLPLADKEVVLTFDDGPLPAYTGQILSALAAECAKATFFMVGSMARVYPDWVRRVYNAGHTVATHSHRHPRFFDQLAHDAAEAEIDQGIEAVAAALGDRRALAPFFRFPGLRHSVALERSLAERGIMVWSADFTGDDWRPIDAEDVIARALARLEEKGRGVLLLHDIQARTALALPNLLRELKLRGYRLVHVVPTGADRPQRVREPPIWAKHRFRKSIWPPVAAMRPSAPPQLPVPSAMSFGFPNLFGAVVEIPSADANRAPFRLAAAAVAAPGPAAAGAGSVVWPPPADARPPAESEIAEQAVPGRATIDWARAPLPDLHTPASPPEAAGAGRPQRAAARQPRIEARTRAKPPAAPRENWARRLNWFH